MAVFNFTGISVAKQIKKRFLYGIENCPMPTLLITTLVSNPVGILIPCVSGTGMVVWLWTTRRMPSVTSNISRYSDVCTINLRSKAAKIVRSLNSFQNVCRWGNHNILTVFKPSHDNTQVVDFLLPHFAVNICLTSVTHIKCGVRSTLYWKIANISGST